MNYIIKKTEGPVYLQIYRYIRDDIISGIFPFNSKLPSKRTLADRLGVSIVTAEHAYALLCDEGYIESRERSGYYVIFRQTDGFASVVPSEKITQVYHTVSTSSYPGFSISTLNKTIRKVLTNYYDVILDKSPNSG